MGDRPISVRVGVFLDQDQEEPEPGQEGLYGHTGATGRKSPSRAWKNRVVELGEDVLRAAAQAVGNEIAVVVAGVVGGIDRPGAGGAANGADTDVPAPTTSSVLDTGSFSIESVELTFGVKASVGVGPAVTALLTAGGEADVEVKITLVQRDK